MNTCKTWQLMSTCACQPRLTFALRAVLYRHPFFQSCIFCIDSGPKQVICCTCRYASPLHKGPRQWRNPQLQASAGRMELPARPGRRWQDFRLDQSLSQAGGAASTGRRALAAEQLKRSMEPYLRQSGRRPQALEARVGQSMQQPGALGHMQLPAGKQQAGQARALDAASFHAWHKLCQSGLHRQAPLQIALLG